MALLAKKPYDGARLNPVEEVLPMCFTIQHLTGIGEPAINPIGHLVRMPDDF